MSKLSGFKLHVFFLKIICLTCGVAADRNFRTADQLKTADHFQSSLGEIPARDLDRFWAIGTELGRFRKENPNGKRLFESSHLLLVDSALNESSFSANVTHYLMLCACVTLAVLIFIGGVHVVRVLFYPDSPRAMMRDIQGDVLVIRPAKLGSENDPRQRRPSQSIWTLAIASTVLKYIDVTIILPTALLRAQAAGGGMAASGLILGATGIGVMVATPVFLAFVSHKNSSQTDGCSSGSYRGSLVVFVGLSLCGNVSYILCTSIEALVVSCAVKGLAGGILISNLYVIAALSSEDNHTKHFTSLTGWGFVGTALGPGLGGFLWMLVQAATGEEGVTFLQVVAPSVLMCILMVLFLFVVVVFAPNPQQLMTDANYKEPESRSWTTTPGRTLHFNQPPSPLLTFHTFVTLTTCVCMTSIQTFAYFGFQAGQDVVLQQQYAFSPSFSGFAVMLCAGLAVMVFFWKGGLTGREPTAKMMLTVRHAIVIVACILMLACAAVYGFKEEPGSMQLFPFLIASFGVYCGSMLAAPLLHSLTLQVRRDSKYWILQRRSALAVRIVCADGLGLFLGPMVFRISLFEYAGHWHDFILGLATLTAVWALLMLLWWGMIPDDSVRRTLKGYPSESLNAGADPSHPRQSPNLASSSHDMDFTPFSIPEVEEEEEEGEVDEELDEEVRGAMAAALAECEQLRRLLAEMKIRSSMVGTSDEWSSSMSRSSDDDKSIETLQADLAHILKHSDLDQSVVTQRVEDGQGNSEESPERRLAEKLKCKQLMRLLKQCRKLRRKVAECAVRASYTKAIFECSVHEDNLSRIRENPTDSSRSSVASETTQTESALSTARHENFLHKL